MLANMNESFNACRIYVIVHLLVSSQLGGLRARVMREPVAS